MGYFNLPSRNCAGRAAANADSPVQKPNPVGKSSLNHSPSSGARETVASWLLLSVCMHQSVTASEGGPPVCCSALAKACSSSDVSFLAMGLSGACGYALIPRAESPPASLPTCHSHVQFASRKAWTRSARGVGLQLPRARTARHTEWSSWPEKASGRRIAALCIAAGCTPAPTGAMGCSPHIGQWKTHASKGAITRLGR
jgi:hypothetical protein